MDMERSKQAARAKDPRRDEYWAAAKRKRENSIPGGQRKQSACGELGNRLSSATPSDSPSSTRARNEPRKETFSDREMHLSFIPHDDICPYTIVTVIMHRYQALPRRSGILIEYPAGWTRETFERRVNESASYRHNSTHNPPFIFYFSLSSFFFFSLFFLFFFCLCNRCLPSAIVIPIAQI